MSQMSMCLNKCIKRPINKVVEHNKQNVPLIKKYVGNANCTYVINVNQCTLLIVMFMLMVKNPREY